MGRRVTLAAAGALVLALAGPVAARDPAPKGEEAARATLWAALQKAKPKDLVVDAYGENPSLTQVCFLAGGRVYLFTLEDGKVTEEVFMKFLPKINRITFRPAAGPGKDRGDFVLWADGQVEMAFDRSR